MKMYLLFEVVACSARMFFYPASVHVLYSHVKLAFLSTICVFGSCFTFVFLFSFFSFLFSLNIFFIWRLIFRNSVCCREEMRVSDAEQECSLLKAKVKHSQAFSPNRLVTAMC